MKINRNLIERIDIADFAERHDLIMKVNERSCDIMNKFNIKDAFYASFEGAEVKGSGCLIGTYGDGMNEDIAIRDYATRISGKTLVFNAYGKDRYEIQVPYLCYDPRKRRN